MEVGPEFEREYESACADLIDLGPVAEKLIAELLNARSIKTHSVRHRVKDRSSLRRKLQTKSDSYRSLEDVHDLLGIRVITFFPDEVDAVASVIESEFAIDSANSRDPRAALDPDQFGYLSVHYVVELSPERSALTEHTRFAGRKFEVQVRSILQHAWAEIEHDLGYHTAGSVPYAVRRRFSRLAGLLEVADDEFQRLRDDVTQYQAELRSESRSNLAAASIDRDSLVAFVRSNPLVAKVEDAFAASQDGAEITPIEDDPMFASGLASEMQLVGFESVGEVEAALQAHADEVVSFYKGWLADARMRGFTQGLSLFYLAYVVLAERGSLEEIFAYFNAVPLERTQARRRAGAEKVLRVYGAIQGGDNLP